MILFMLSLQKCSNTRIKPLSDGRRLKMVGMQWDLETRAIYREVASKRRKNLVSVPLCGALCVAQGTYATSYTE